MPPVVIPFSKEKIEEFIILQLKLAEELDKLDGIPDANSELAQRIRERVSETEFARELMNRQHDVFLQNDLITQYVACCKEQNLPALLIGITIPSTERSQRGLTIWSGSFENPMERADLRCAQCDGSKLNISSFLEIDCRGAKLSDLEINKSNRCLLDGVFFKPETSFVNLNGRLGNQPMECSLNGVVYDSGCTEPGDWRYHRFQLDNCFITGLQGAKLCNIELFTSGRELGVGALLLDPEIKADLTECHFAGAYSYLQVYRRSEKGEILPSETLEDALELTAALYRWGAPLRYLGGSLDSEREIFLQTKIDGALTPLAPLATVIRRGGECIQQLAPFFQEPARATHVLAVAPVQEQAPARAGRAPSVPPRGGSGF